MNTIDHVCSAFLRQIFLRMKELGISQTDLAKRMRVSRPYISKVLRQDVNFSFRTAAKLARALKMDFFPDLRPQESDLPAETAMNRLPAYQQNQSVSSQEILTTNH